MPDPILPLGGDLVDHLDRIIAEGVRSLIEDPYYGRLHDGTASRELYLRFLERTYTYVLYTTKQLDDAARILAASPDPVCRAFAAKFEHHSEEEAGHDIWVLDDIRALGGDVEAVKRAEPCLAVRAYAALLDVALKSDHPLGIAGCGQFLEGVSERIGRQMSENFRRNSKIPNIENALTFIAAHGEADQAHMAESRTAWRTITNEADKAAIVLFTRLTSAWYPSLLFP